VRTGTTDDLERVLTKLVIQFVDMEVAAHPPIVAECGRDSPSSSEGGAVLYEALKIDALAYSTHGIGYSAEGSPGTGRAKP
jgi:hypothetical protein